MPTLPLPFTSLDKSADKPTMSTFNQNQLDGYWMPYGSPDGVKLIWFKRPGLTEFCNLGENGPVDGIHYWTPQLTLYASCNGKMFSVDEDGAETDVTGTAAMTARTRPTFTDIAGTTLYAASGGQIGAYPAGAGAYIADADAPTAVRFIHTLNKILIAQRDNSSRFDWANAGDPDTWDGLFAEAEAEPDVTKSFLVANNYLYFVGQKTTELWRDDGETFVREGQGIVSRGTLAPYSVVEINGVIYWLDETREFIALSGLTPTLISNPNLSRYMSSFDTVADARADYLRIEGKHFALWHFPTARKTLVYDIIMNQWYEWSYFNAVTAEHEQWLGQTVAHAPDWNKALCGDRRTGKIWEIGGTTDDGGDIKTVIRTDFVDRGTDARKRSHELVMVFKRADTATTPNTMLVRWRDDGETDWGPYREVGIEEQGQTELIVRLRRLGIYRRRQWEIVMSDASQAALLSAMERFDIGG